MMLLADNGVCTNPGCPNVDKLVERYPGPGEYCPECGDELQVVHDTPPPAAAVPVIPAAVPAVAATAPAAAAAPAPAAAPAAAAATGRRGVPRAAIGAILAGVAMLALGAVFAIPKLVTRGTAGAVHVCGSSLTQRLAVDVIRAYAARSGTDASAFAIDGNGGCDVVFSATASAPGDQIIAHDGLVVIVNPQNPLTRLNPDRVRQIFGGSLTDWSQAGGARGPIVAMLPKDDTDEVRALSGSLLQGMSIGGGVRRFFASPEITAAVASASGRHAIGIVPFSAAVPAKVVILDAIPAPSVLSIAKHHYPFVVSVAVTSNGTSGDVAAGLLRFARSDDAQAIVTRDGFIGRRGP